MAKLSPVQVAAVSYDAGWRGGNYVRAVAVALAESGGNSSIQGRGDRDDLGLFQVNSRYHPEILQGDWTDPLFNARTAHAIWQKDGWQPWNSSRPGQILNMPIATLVTGGGNTRPAANYPGGSGKNPAVILGQTIPGTGSSTTGNPLTAAGDAIKFLSVGQNWARIGIIALGGLLLVVALANLAKPGIEEAIKVATIAK